MARSVPRLEAEGQIIGNNDLWIAAQENMRRRQASFSSPTTNASFRRVQGLRWPQHQPSIIITVDSAVVLALQGTQDVN
jgi:hypothetical protein